jgi:hypothetical protein
MCREEVGQSLQGRVRFVLRVRLQHGNNLDCSSGAFSARRRGLGLFAVAAVTPVPGGRRKLLHSPSRWPISRYLSQKMQPPKRTYAGRAAPLKRTFGPSPAPAKRTFRLILLDLTKHPTPQAKMQVPVRLRSCERHSGGANAEQFRPKTGTLRNRCAAGME